MVTHNWSNLFLHLIAAIFADALGEKYYAGSEIWVAGELVRSVGFVDLVLLLHVVRLMAFIVPLLL